MKKSQELLRDEIKRLFITANSQEVLLDGIESLVRSLLKEQLEEVMSEVKSRKIPDIDMGRLDDFGKCHGCEHDIRLCRCYGKNEEIFYVVSLLKNKLEDI